MGPAKVNIQMPAGSLQEPPPAYDDTVPLLWTLEEDGSLTEAPRSGDSDFPPQHASAAGMKPYKVGLNLIKCAVGAGSFSLPKAFQMGGLWGSSVGTVILGGLAAYTFCILADAEKFHARKDRYQRRLTYPQTAAVCLPSLSFGKINVAEIFVYAMIILTALGASMAYVVFIATTMPAVIKGAVPGEVLLVLIPICIPLLLLRTYKFLAYTSILGDFAVLAGVTATLAYGISKNSLSPDLPAFNASGIGPAMGNIAFLFLSHIVALPMAQSLKGDLADPRRYHSVVWTSFVVITLCNLLFGAFCYLLFGANTQDNIIKNLNTGTILQVVRVLLCIDLLFTIPMLLGAAREIIEETIMAGSWAQRHETFTRNMTRITMLLIVLAGTYGVVMGDSNNAFGNVVTLVGGICCFALGFIVPPMLHLANHGWLRAGVVSFTLHILLTLVGIVGLAASTYFTLAAM